MPLPENIKIKFSPQELKSFKDGLFEFISGFKETDDLIRIMRAALLVNNYRRVSTRLITPRKSYTIAFPLAEAIAVLISWGGNEMKLSQYQEEVYRDISHTIFKKLL